jgi:hypothetical protein
LRETLGIVDILISRDAAVDGLAEQIGQWELGVLPAPRIAQVFGDEFAEAQTFVQLAHQNQATVGGDPRSLEIDLEGGVAGKPEWLNRFRAYSPGLRRGLQSTAPPELHWLAKCEKCGLV